MYCRTCLNRCFILDVVNRITPPFLLLQINSCPLRFYKRYILYLSKKPAILFVVTFQDHRSCNPSHTCILHILFSARDELSQCFTAKKGIVHKKGQICKVLWFTEGFMYRRACVTEVKFCSERLLFLSMSHRILYSRSLANHLCRK